MPFGLKNVRTTHQKMVNKVFGSLIGNVIEAYVDDMVVKSAKTCDHVSDLLQGFDVASLVEQLVFALIVPVTKLRPYFQSHTVQVMTNQPIKQIIYRPETSRKMLKRKVELREFDVEFKPRTAIKAQVLADFTIKVTIPPSIPEDETPY
ncbi:RNA-directed DNA polymerase [Abeliophyllum distichum]|uniref:RNA-directed DNA polymerase n=1 Tax=Abeliophyllum distichum TaxID=126358 RepID=A0ABD1RSV9_9LAMI